MTDITLATPTQTRLPGRERPRPRTTPATPHVQLDQPAPEALQAELWRRMTSLEGMTPGNSNISAPSSRALHLDAVLARGPRQAYLSETEFAHLHGDGSGSLHLTLPQARGAEAIAQGWGEVHPAAGMGIAPPTLLMLYGPRDAGQLEVVWQLIQESYAYARGDQEDPTRPVTRHARELPSQPVPDGQRRPLTPTTREARS
jgi:hypothetical protein